MKFVAIYIISLQILFLKGNSADNSKRGTMQSSTSANLAQIYKTRPKLYHQESQKSYRESTRGPCSPSMVFEKSPSDPTKGICACVASNGCVSNNPNYAKTGPLLRHPETNQCYRINSQGPCLKSSVLMKDPSQEGVGICRYPSWDCGKVPSINGAKIRETLSNLGLSSEYNFIAKDSKMYVYNETCYRTWTQGHCSKTGQPDRKNKRGEMYAVFVGTLPEPFCFSRLKYALKAVTCRFNNNKDVGGSGVTLVPSGQCPQKFKRVGLDCVPEV